MKLTPEERRILRIVVKNVHFKMYPKEFCTDHEADKMIAVIADETKAKLVKIGKDSKIEQMQCGGCGTCGTLLDVWNLWKIERLTENGTYFFYTPLQVLQQL